MFLLHKIFVIFLVWISPKCVPFLGYGHIGSKPSPKPMMTQLLSGEPDYFGRNKISSGGDLSHYSSVSLY